MGASGTEWLYFRMEVEHYRELSEDFRGAMDIQKVEHDKVEYYEDETWCNLKSQSIKAYKKLKEHEYNLKNK